MSARQVSWLRQGRLPALSYRAPLRAVPRPVPAVHQAPASDRPALPVLRAQARLPWPAPLPRQAYPAAARPLVLPAQEGDNPLRSGRRRRFEPRSTRHRKSARCRRKRPRAARQSQCGLLPARAAEAKPRRKAPLSRGELRLSWSCRDFHKCTRALYHERAVRHAGSGCVEMHRSGVAGAGRAR